jgi:hypothetical protein
MLLLPLARQGVFMTSKTAVNVLAAAILQQACQTGDIPLEAHWVEFLRGKGTDPLFSSRLAMILNTFMVKTSSPQVRDCLGCARCRLHHDSSS